MNEELKPCPFCGGEAVLCQWPDTENPNATWVECKNGCGETIHHADKEQAKQLAIEAWNKRKTAVTTPTPANQAEFGANGRVAGRSQA